MKKNVTIYHKISRILVGVVFLVLLAAGGCSNVLMKSPAAPEAAGPGGGVKVTLRLFTGSARTVMPEMDLLTWRITAEQDTDNIEATGTYPTYTLELPTVGRWIFTVKGINPTGDEIFTGSITQEIGGGSTVSISIPLSPGSGMGEGTGTIDLTMTVPTDVTKVMYKLDSDTEFTDLTPSNGSCSLNKAGVSAGPHTLSLYFLDERGTTLYMCTEAVNVWNGMTSSQWINTGNIGYITGNGEFELTDVIIDAFLNTMGSVVYVNDSVAVNAPATGSIFAPVNSVSTAVDILRKANPGGNYTGTIMVSGATTIDQEIEVKNGETLTVKGTGADASITNDAGRVFNIASGGSLTLGENITLTGTNATGNGGAVYVNGGTFTMENGSAITGGQAAYGGGVYVAGGNFIMEGNSIITESSATGTTASGGAVYVAGGTFTMNGTAILQGNTATTHGGGVHILSGGTFIMNGGTIDGTIGGTAGNTAENGGGVFVSGGTFNMYDGTISGNTVTESGGGVCISGGTFTMSDSAVISGNTATRSGGGVFVSGSGNFIMEGGTIGGTGGESHNSAENGGGVYIHNGAFTMSDGSISGNTATDNGGGVYVGDGTFTMSGGTISGNTATQKGGGVYVSSTGNFTLGSSSAESSPVVSGNTKTGNSTNNVYLDDGTILLIGGELKKSKKSGNIGISMATPGEEFTSGWSNSGLRDSTFFFSDDTKRTVALSGSELSLNLVHVEGGSCILNGKQVTLSSFWISPYEVTQAEFESIMTGNANDIEPNPSEFQGEEKLPAEGEEQGRRPVEKVNWYDAIVYCNLLSIKEGLTPCYTIKGSTTPADWGTSPTLDSVGDYDDWKSVTCNFDANGYRLPTEAEWEYAARGGKTGITDGSWGNTYSGSTTPDDVAWYTGNSDSKTHEVGKKQDNALGLYDMSGNAGEWCWDWRSDPYPSNTENPAGPGTGEKRVRRGGTINNTPVVCDVEYQNSADPWQKGFCFGFRVVRSIR